MFPALLAGFGLAFARGIGEYGSVVFIAGNIPYKTQIAPLLIMMKLEQYKYADAYRNSTGFADFVFFINAGNQFDSNLYAEIL